MIWFVLGYLVLGLLTAYIFHEPFATITDLPVVVLVLLWWVWMVLLVYGCISVGVDILRGRPR